MQSNEWYYTLGGSRRGPATEDQMRKLILSKQLTGDGTLVWCSQMSDWQKLGELEVFHPSLELIKRAEEEEKTRQAQRKREYFDIQGYRWFRRDAAEHENKQSVEEYLKHIYLKGAIRASIASLLVILFWLWIYTPQNQLSTFLTPIPLGLLAGLCSGQYFPDRSYLLFKTMAGSIAMFAYLFLKYAKYVVDQGAVFGENFTVSLLTTSPFEGLQAILGHLSSWDIASLIVSFSLGFTMAIHGYIIMVELARYRRCIEN